MLHMGPFLRWIKCIISTIIIVVIILTSAQSSAITQASATEGPTGKTSQSRPRCLTDGGFDRHSCKMRAGFLENFITISSSRPARKESKGCCIYAWFPQLIMSDQWCLMTFREGARDRAFMFEACLWPPLRRLPCWLTANYRWWLDHDDDGDASRAPRPLSEIILGSLLFGGGGRSNKGTPEEQGVCTLLPFQWLPQTFWT